MNVPAGYEYEDQLGNKWKIYIAMPEPLAMHEGETTYHWRMMVQTPDGGAVSHGHQNLAVAVAECILKLKLWKRVVAGKENDDYP
jgi:hypothetical protein